MVRLSKPGQQAEYVSYLDKIDDENVLKGLEAVRRKAGGSTPTRAPNSSMQKENPIMVTPSRPKGDTTHPGTPPSQSIKSSIHDSPLTTRTVSTSGSNSGTRNSGPRTPKTRNVGTIRGFNPCTPETQRPASSPQMTSKVTSSKAPSAFIPKWKLKPRIEPPHIPRWQLETAAQERAAAEREAEQRTATEREAKQRAATERGAVEGSAAERGAGERASSDQPQVPTQSLKEPNVKTDCGTSGLTTGIPTLPKTSEGEVPEDGPSTMPKYVSGLLFETMKRLQKTRHKWTNSGTACFTGINAMECPVVLERSDASTIGSRAQINTNGSTIEDGRFRNNLSVKSFDDLKECTTCDDIHSFDNFISRSVKMTSLLNKLGCFGMVDPILKPSNDFDENFTYCSATYATDTIVSDDGASECKSTGKSPFVEKSVPNNEVAVIEYLTDKGFGELAPIISMLARFKSFLAQGKSDPLQLQHISNLLCNMEDNIQEYGGYRRRRGKYQADNSADFQTLSDQIDDLNKLILRVVEDFIDDRLFDATDTEMLSLASALSEAEVASLLRETDTLLGEEDMSTLGDESFSFEDETEMGNESMLDPRTLSPQRKYLPSIVTRSFSMKSKHSMTRGDDRSILSFMLAGGRAEFVSADKFIQDHEFRSAPRFIKYDKENAGPNLNVGTSRDDSSLMTSQTNGSRTSHLANTFSNVFSRSPKRGKPEHEMRKDKIQARTVRPFPLDNAVLASSEDALNPRLPPLDPRSNHGSRKDSPVRRLFGGRHKTKRRGSGGSETRIFLQEAIDDKGSTMSGIESIADLSQSGMSFVDVFDSRSADPKSVVIVQESSDGDSSLLAIESIVGIAASPIHCMST